MATRLWESLVGRRGSNAEDLFSDEDGINSQTSPARKSSSQVQTLGSMRSKSNSIGANSISSMSSSANGTAAAGSDASNSSPDQQAAHPPSRSASVQSSKAPEQAAKGFNQNASPFSAAAGANKVPFGTNHSGNSSSTAVAAGMNHEGSDAAEDPAHDSASSTVDGRDSAGHLSRRSSSNNKSPAHVPAASAPAGPTSAPQDHHAAANGAMLDVSDAERCLSLSLGFSDHMSGSNLASSAAPAAISTSAHQHSDMSFVPSTQSMQAAGQGSSAQQHGSATPTDGSTPRLSSPTGLGLGLFSTPLPAEPTGLGAGLGLGLLGMPSPGSGGPAGPSMEALIAELQATAGLTAEQAAAAAAVMMPRMATPTSPLAQPNPFQAPTTTTHNPWAHSPPGQGFTMPQPLSPISPMALHSSSNPDLGAAGLLAMGAQAELLGSPVAALGAAGAFGGPLMGFDSVHSSTSNNVVLSGSGFALMGGSAAGGMLSPENSYLAEAAQYAHDGLDVPGTAQVAVHNVPFKWCNDDLEELFREQEGYLDAQLLFHENGRSKGVGVGLFRDRSCAVEACNKLSGAQADGRKLELVLMNPDNHVSFSCRQVAVLGLPWEYTSADVRALLEAAAEADGAAPTEAGVEHVEVAYRDDGKSEGRAIATFASRRQAHDAIRRLHGKETLAGLRMRLFYLHEQQQTRNQNVLAQLRAQPLQILIPGMAGLALGEPSPSPRHPGSMAATPGSMAATPGASTPVSQQLFPAPGGSGDVASGEQVSSSQNAEGQAAGKEGEGAGEGAAAGGQGEARAPEGDVAPGSGRSSLDKDQGPVILHVSGLMESVTREQLRELFSQAGEVTKVDIPDGGRSMGYGFITFSNPQAAEQAMLLFNNYPLGGGAIHVAYSTSATAKARQQALRQARKATLGNSRASTDGGPGRQPGTPRGMAGAGRTPRGPGVNSFPSNPSLAGLGGGLGGLEGLNPARHSFDYTGGYPGSVGGFYPRGPAALSPGGLGGLGGMSSSLGALAGTPPGMHAAAAMGRARRNSFEYGMGPVGALGLLQGAGGSAGYPAGLAGFDVSTAGNLDQQLQLLMQMTGTAGEPGPFGPGAGALLGMPGAQPGTPPPGGLRTSPIGAGNSGSLFSPPMSAAAGFSGMVGAGALSTPPGPYMGAPGGVFGGNAATAAAGQSSLFTSPGIGGSQVLVTGLPPGLSDGDLRALFEICGPLRSVSKQQEQDFAIITYDTAEHARKAISVLDGTRLPSGTTLSLQFTNLMMQETLTKAPNDPWNLQSPATGPNTPNMFAGAAGLPSPINTGLATPPRGSFAGDGSGVIHSGAIHSGSLFPVAEAGNTGELFSGAFGSNVGGMGHLGGFGSVGSGLRVGATSPAFGKPPRDGAGPAAAATSALYSPTPMRAGSPGPGSMGVNALPGRVGSGVHSGPGLPPMYSGSAAGMSASGSAGNLFGGSQGGMGMGMAGGAGSDGGSAHGSDGGHP